MKRVQSFVLAIVLVVAGVLGAWQGQRDSDKQRSAAQHSFADVERYRAIFESSERDAWQKPEELIAALGVKPGMVIADIGAGTGYFARRFAVRVGPAGTVFASDLEPNMVVEMRDRADRDGQANLIPVLASTDDPRLPDRLSDVIFICDTWHHLADRVEYARRLQDDLAPGGRVVIVDFFKRELPVGPPPPHKLAAEDVKAEFEEAGYRLAASLDLLPYQYVFIFELASP